MELPAEYPNLAALGASLNPNFVVPKQQSREGAIKTSSFVVTHLSAPSIDDNNNTPEQNRSLVEKALSNAIKDNVITTQMAGDLKQQYKDKPSKLENLLVEFAKARIEKLMATDWKELDNSTMNEELAEKFRLGYELKRFIVFGKQKNGSVDPDALLQFGIDKGCIPDEHKDWIKQGHGGDANKMVSEVEKRILNYVEQMMSLNWDALQKNDKIEDLKAKFFAGFKIKYKEKFGLDYKPESGI